MNAKVMDVRAGVLLPHLYRGNIRVVNEQIFAFPLELDVGVFALIVGKPTSLNRRFHASLFQVGNGGFHETHPIHHPIQIFQIVIDDGLRCLYAPMVPSFYPGRDR